MEKTRHTIGLWQRKMIWVMIMLMAFIVCFTSVSAWSSNTFNNSLGTENLTFNLGTIKYVADFNTLANPMNGWLRDGSTGAGCGTPSYDGSECLLIYSAPYGSTGIINKTMNATGYLSINYYTALSTTNVFAIYKNNIFYRNLTNTLSWTNINVSVNAGDNITLMSLGTSYTKLDNITEYDNRNFIRNLTIPSNVFVTNASISMRGYDENFTYYQETPDVVSCEGVFSTGANNCTAGYDGNWNTYAQGGATSGYIYFNYSKAGNTRAVWMVKGGLFAPANYSIPSHCFDYHADKLVLRSWVEGASSGWNYACRNSTAWFIVASGTGASDRNYEEAINWFAISSNVNISVNNNQAFYYGGVFNHTNKTNNFYNVINNYLSSCTYLNGYCYVPINFHSDTIGVIEYFNLNFNNLGFVETSQTYGSSVIEYSTNLFSINFSYDSNYYISANAYLNYNGTNYAGTKSGTGNTLTFSRSATAPSVTANSNVPFYWIIILNNGTAIEYYNSTNYTQQVVNLVYGSCNATSQYRIINFTTYDEDIRNQLLLSTYNNTYSVDMKIGDSGLTSYAQYSLNTSGNSLAICVNASLVSNLRMDYVIQYGSTSHVTEYLNVQNYTLNLTTINQNVSLYPLLTTSSQEFLIKVKDATYLALQGAVIEIYRKYVELGTTKLIEAPLTDTLGQSIGHFKSNDVLYNIIIKRNGQTLGTFENIQVYCNVALTDCILNLNLESAGATPTSYVDYRGISYIPTYNETLRTYYLDFTTINGDDKKVDIYGFKIDNTQTTLVCSDTTNSSAGVLVCSFTGINENSTILINAYVDSELLFTDYVNADYTKAEVIGKVRYVLLAFLIPVFVVLSLSSGAVAIILYFIGLGFGIGIYALDTQSYIGAGSFLVWFVVAGIILIIKIMRGGVKNG